MTNTPARSPVTSISSAATGTASSADPAPDAAPAPKEAPATTPRVRDDGWTLPKQAAFLRALSATHSISEAARSVGMSRQSAYQLRARLKGEPFDLAWAEALRSRFDALAECALERAMFGVEVPHFYKGEIIGTSRKFDERLTVALLAMRNRLTPPLRLPASAGFDVTPDFEGLLGVIESGVQSWHEVWRNEAEARIEESDAPCARWGLRAQGEEHSQLGAGWDRGEEAHGA